MAKVTIEISDKNGTIEVQVVHADDFDPDGDDEHDTPAQSFARMVWEFICATIWDEPGGSEMN